MPHTIATVATGPPAPLVSDSLYHASIGRIELYTFRTNIISPTATISVIVLMGFAFCTIFGGRNNGNPSGLDLGLKHCKDASRFPWLLGLAVVQQIRYNMLSC